MLNRYKAYFANFFFSAALLFSAQVYAEKIRFIIDICSYNNSKWYKENLDSIFGENGQIYENFHVIYTDDCSTDGTADLVEEYIKSSRIADKITLIRNTERRKQLANHYRVVKMAREDDVIVVLDGDDFFAHPWVLAKLHKVYNNDHIWMTYGQFKNWPDNVRGYCKKTTQEIVDENSFRDNRWFWGHLRSYRAWLANLVKLEDLIISDVKNLHEIARKGAAVSENIVPKMYQYQGHFFPAAADLALGYPMLEMARGHVKFLRGIHYKRNVANNINTFKTEFETQQYCARYVRSKGRYNEISTPVKYDFSEAKADVLIYFDHDYSALQTCAESVRYFLNGVNDIFLIYDANKVSDFEKLRAIRSILPRVKFIDLRTRLIGNAVINILQSSEAAHLVCMLETDKIIHEINLNRCIASLETTYAHGLYLHPYNDNSPPIFEQVGIEDLNFWQFKLAEDWCNPYELHGALYRKGDFVNALQRCSAHTLDELEQQLSNVCVDQNKIGLFFNKPRAVIH